MSASCTSVAAASAVSESPLASPSSVVDNKPLLAKEEEEEMMPLELDLQRFDSEADALMNSIREELFTPTASKEESSHNSTRSATNAAAGRRRRPRRQEPALTGETPDEYGEEIRLDDCDVVRDDDDSMGDEMSRLNTVVASIKQDLDNQSVDSMISMLSANDHHRGASFRFSGTQLGLQAPPNQQNFEPMEMLYDRKHQQVEPLSGPLLFLSMMAWSVVFVLIHHAVYGDIMEDSTGALQSLLPETFQKLLDRLLLEE